MNKKALKIFNQLPFWARYKLMNDYKIMSLSARKRLSVLLNAKYGIMLSGGAL